MVEKRKLLEKSLREYPKLQKLSVILCSQLKRNYTAYVKLKGSLNRDETLEQKFKTLQSELKRDYRRLMAIKDYLQAVSNKLLIAHATCYFVNTKNDLWSVRYDYDALSKKIVCFFRPSLNKKQEA